MRIDIATLFPEMCEAILSESIVGRARKKGALEIYCHQIRDYTNDKHRRVDDIPYGGGMGMVMQADPIYNCYNAVCEQLGAKPHTIYMTPKGSVFNQKKAVQLAQLDNIFLLCGHYEGVDQRILDKIVDEEISIGDYVLTGGELPAAVLTDAVARMCDGVLSSPECYQDESHFGGLLEYPQYTRPEIWQEEAVPSVLLSGHHKNIAEWRLKKSLEITKEKRPDMYEAYINNSEKCQK
ncbi:tRNA (guanosine(37)-N1)-methyltransferase TrmD [Porcipelethomonas ammoniilytica]|jgi:tRNA (guanine-N(1)-)-methyltransferase|uniref:tRNA (guanosine(37)-N1)-methyltransferase TrmD n=1 Tax=Porcipelethomonas ammoniilytica TaxID=2981722 RepID=UPI000822C453|nr:tRNA (guanosine(37)-N1)-methyltransferase TrmD [Porcipelethomonas ammoniilytica]MCU6719797.1 tRNA (guanosine(37)-N1)-methyltransferase TrmD [Porcipelethomonas ammoniilytica]MEE0185020.1 tRNA (guanosine(37)-N1)-methyltransferase TrmD [Oscillospiraceae bacterium]OLA71599.1 MAG: tRNA (guanosine(37)-N1)-methyltransferase TrmD [Ruminococcus sp. 37_24]SCI92520.1 tRNA (guanine-N(1)-)-methyltransferase [uncultured Ruminococcus sp.]